MRILLSLILSLTWTTLAVAAPGESSARLTEVIPSTVTVVLPTAIPTAIGTPQHANTAALCKTFVTNGTNVDVNVSIQGANAIHKTVPAGSEWFENWCANGQKMSGAIQVNILATTPTPASGTVVIGGSSK